MYEKMQPIAGKLPAMLNLDTVNMEDRSQSLEEIETLIECIFDQKEHLTLAEFKDVTENMCSDLFVVVFFKRYFWC